MDVEVYTEKLCRRHHADLLDAAVLFRAFSLCLALGMALVVAWSTGGFWVLVVPVYTHPTVQYTGEALLLFQGAQASQDLIWSSSPLINSQFPGRIVPATIQVADEHYQADGVPQVIEIMATVQGVAPVTSIKGLFQFKYSIEEGPVGVQMYCLAYLHAASTAPGGALFAEGELLLSQRTPLNAYVYDYDYNVPVLDLDSSNSTTVAIQPSMFEFQDIISSYLSRNITTTLANQYQVWKAGSGNSFQISLRVQVPANQLVLYRPEVVENLKYGWIQFLATYVTFWWGLSKLEAFAFQHHLFSTRKRSDTQPSTQRF